MNIKDQGHSLTFPKGHSGFSNLIFFLKNCWVIQTKYHVKASGSTGTKKVHNWAWSHEQDAHILLKTFYKNLLENQLSEGLETCYVALST